MFPYRDENPTSSIPFITIGIIFLNIAVWLFVEKGGFSAFAMSKAMCDWGLIPGEITGLAAGEKLSLYKPYVCVIDDTAEFRTFITMQFMHGGWFHLIGNMLFLWVFGNNIEDAVGSIKFIIFYISCGVFAALCHILLQPSSIIPTIGASGAVSGVLGAYLILYPRVRVWTFIPIFFYFLRIPIPAWFFLVYWFFMQSFSMIVELPDVLFSSAKGGVAYSAHVGGFIAGVFLIKTLHKKKFKTKRLPY